MRTSKVVLRLLKMTIRIFLVVLICGGLLYAAKSAYDIGYRIYTETPVESEPGTDVEIVVGNNLSAYSLGKLLKSHGLIDNAIVFTVQMKLSQYADTVIPGTYTLNTSQTATEMLAILSTEVEEEVEEETEDEEAEASDEE